MADTVVANTSADLSGKTLATASAPLTTGQPVIGGGGDVVSPLGAAFWPVTKGGTGLITVAQGDLIYASAADTLARLAKDANATRYLSNQGASNSPSWNQVNLANGVTGTLPVANGGTGLTDAAQIRVATATLLNAAIITLPTAAVQIVAPPASGFVIRPLSVSLRANFAAGGYGNFNAAGYFAVRIVGADPILAILPNDIAIVNTSFGCSTTMLTQFFGIGDRYAVLSPLQNTEQIDQWGMIPVTSVTTAQVNGQALVILIENNGTGNLSLGNIANTLKVTVYYVIEPL